ncbi:MAG: hypothetical protein J7K34_09390 [Flavobacteriaceae bacterium]|nr:hypothetical protein [Flavobacteriaceae bacterium]
MKKSFLFLLIGIVLFGCSEKDDIEEVPIKGIVGEWKLIKAEYVAWGSRIVDYSDDHIIYDFQSNGVLIVSKDHGEFIKGEYDYEFGEFYLGGYPSPGEPKLLLVKINNSKWTYNLSNRIMKLGQSYVDGPYLYFEKR